MNISKSLFKQILLIVALVGSAALCLAFVFHLTLNIPVQVVSAPFATDSNALNTRVKTNYGLPVRLKIPEINVNVAIEKVGLTTQGDLGVPISRTSVGWYDQGPRPGDKGSSVIDGHYGWWMDGTPAVFNNLYKLHQGDKIYIEDENGTIITFVVSKLQIYVPNGSDLDVFRSNDSLSHLNLITCEGVWDQAQKSYSNRLVVFADKE